jgi:hypothetical protein
VDVDREQLVGRRLKDVTVVMDLPQSVGGPRAGEIGGGSIGSPRALSIFRIGPGSVVKAMSRMSQAETRTQFHRWNCVLPAPKRDLIGELPRMRRSGRTDVGDLEVSVSARLANCLCGGVRGSGEARHIDVRVGQDSPIHSDQLTSMRPGRGDDDLIRRIVVKCPRQATGVGSDFGRQWQERHPGIRKCGMKPLVNRHGQTQTTSLHQLGDLPAGDRTDPDASGFVLGDEVFDLRNQTIVLVNPPDPDVGINNDHWAASQSPSATLP